MRSAAKRERSVLRVPSRQPMIFQAESGRLIANSRTERGACRTLPIHFVIADGIMAMEGNGPLNGTPRPLARVVLSDDPVAADATCARLMGFEPKRIVHLREGTRFLGNADPMLIDQVGETAR